MYTKTKRITVSALLIALGVLLSRLFSIPVHVAGTYSLNFGFGMLPILLLCVVYGPVYGCLGGLLWDLVGAILFPMGGFQVWFTIAAAVFGLVTGAFFAKSETEEIYDEKLGYGTARTIYHAAKPATTGRILLAVACGQFVYSVVLNTLLLVMLYGRPANILIVARLMENAVMIFVNTALIKLLLPLLQKTGIIPERTPKASVKISDAVKTAVEVQKPDIEKQMQSAVANEVAMIGGYICNNNYEKAKEIYESAMQKYRTAPEHFTPEIKRDLSNYRKELSEKMPDYRFIVIEDTFDTDAELDILEAIVLEKAVALADDQLSKLMTYFNENRSMFTEEQKARLSKYRMEILAMK